MDIKDKTAEALAFFNHYLDLEYQALIACNEGGDREAATAAALALAGLQFYGFTNQLMPYREPRPGDSQRHFRRRLYKLKRYPHPRSKNPEYPAWVYRAYVSASYSYGEELEDKPADCLFARKIGGVWRMVRKMLICPNCEMGAIAEQYVCSLCGGRGYHGTDDLMIYSEIPPAEVLQLRQPVGYYGDGWWEYECDSALHAFPG